VGNELVRVALAGVCWWWVGVPRAMSKSSSSADLKHASIEIRELPAGLVIALKGDHDLSTKPQLAQALTRLGRGAWARLVLDLRQCTFVDSTIIGAILTAQRQAYARDASVSVVLPADTSYVYRALSVVGLTALVPAHASIEVALGAAAPAVAS
jgi:anti-anti-sigma factor